MRPQIVNILTAVLTIFSCVQMLGQSKSVGPPPPSGGSRMTPPPPELPLDSSLQILVWIALIYGAYWAYKIKIKKKVASV